LQDWAVSSGAIAHRNAWWVVSNAHLLASSYKAKKKDRSAWLDPYARQSL